MINIDFENLEKKVREKNTIYVEGKVRKVIGLTIEVKGIKAFIGERCLVYNEAG